MFWGEGNTEQPFYRRTAECRPSKSLVIWDPHRKYLNPQHSDKQWLSNETQQSEPPIWGRQKGVSPICSDLFRFPRFLPICSDLRSLFSGMPRFVPICSDLLRFLQICFQNKSGQIRETPFCRPLLQIPETTKQGEQEKQHQPLKMQQSWGMLKSTETKGGAKPEVVGVVFPRVELPLQNHGNTMTPPLPGHGNYTTTPLPGQWEYKGPPPLSSPNLCPTLIGGGRGISVAVGNNRPWEYHDPPFVSADKNRSPLLGLQTCPPATEGLLQRMTMMKRADGEVWSL